ncbi:MAG: extracellular solute-binding protein [Firmicutes bacterium]|nr:extracellular solute-binding protein [Bacillota bacterium]
MSVPHNVPSEKQKAALVFMQWALTKENQLQYAKDGAIPVRQDVYEALSSDPKYAWWVQAMAQSTAAMHAPPRMKVTPQIVELLDRRLSAAIVGQAQPQETRDTMAQEIYGILKNGGYNVKPLGQ